MSLFTFFIGEFEVTDKIELFRGFCHLYSGQEACEMLRHILTIDECTPTIDWTWSRVGAKIPLSVC